MLNDLFKAKGTLELKLIDSQGNVTLRKEENLVVNDGLAYIASRIKDSSSTAMSHMAVGQGTATALKPDAILGSELARVALDSTSITTTAVTNDTVQYVATFAPGSGSGPLTEAGLFNASSAGKMLCRTVFAVINKGALDTLVVTWKVTVA
jgi:hypothetical protein